MKAFSLGERFTDATGRIGIIKKVVNVKDGFIIDVFFPITKESKSILILDSKSKKRNTSAIPCDKVLPHKEKVASTKKPYPVSENLDFKSNVDFSRKERTIRLQHIVPDPTEFYPQNSNGTCFICRQQVKSLYLLRRSNIGKISVCDECRILLLKKKNKLRPLRPMRIVPGSFGSGKRR